MEKREHEIIVAYSGEYGGICKCEFVDDIIFFDHSSDNTGSKSSKKTLSKINKLRDEYPQYEVFAGRMDDFAEILWEQRHKLPVLTSEIGDSWIHGSASDPYKSAALRVLISYKNRWLSEGTLQRDSDEYLKLADNILCIAEHTCGMDMKKYFADYENYLRPDFERARVHDKVKLRHPFRDFPQNFLVYFLRKTGEYKTGSYKVIEKSWNEQRLYIERALNVLSEDHKNEIIQEIKRLIPKVRPALKGEALEQGKVYTFGNKKIVLNRFGGIESYVEGEIEVLKGNGRPAVVYRSYGQSDYNFWLSHYTRDIEKNYSWCVGDFARPLLKYADKKYRQGKFEYLMTEGVVSENIILIKLKCDNYCYKNLGAPKKLRVKYRFCESGLSIEVSWFKKAANRLTESISLNLFPNTKNETLRYQRISSRVDPYDVVENGNRKFGALQNLSFMIEDNDKYKITPVHSPLVALGDVNILRFDNKLNSVEQDGLSFILYNNVWGTNFPLWYEDNAFFEFNIEKE